MADVGVALLAAHAVSHEIPAHIPLFVWTAIFALWAIIEVYAISPLETRIVQPRGGHHDAEAHVEEDSKGGSRVMSPTLSVADVNVSQRRACTQKGTLWSPKEGAGADDVTVPDAAVSQRVGEDEDDEDCLLHAMDNSFASFASAEAHSHHDGDASQMDDAAAEVPPGDDSGAACVVVGRDGAHAEDDCGDENDPRGANTRLSGQGAPLPLKTPARQVDDPTDLSAIQTPLLPYW